ncbi:MAG: hypothetical protein NXI30_04275 [bacterium]|nr:hypothetical protein [bacterium]
MGDGTPRRIVIFGVTGQIGQELVDRLDESEWNVAELVGVASPDSAGTTFSFGGLDLDVVGEWPPLKGADLVFLATRAVEALEVVRECLKAEVACIDLTGAVSGQDAVPLVFSATEGAVEAPLLSCPSPTALAWDAVLRAVAGEGAIVRATGTVLASAAAHGRAGVVALSEESIALFNQSERPAPGPAGQGVAFDVLPSGNLERARVELRRSLGGEAEIAMGGAEVPTFVGEATSLLVELDAPVDLAAITERLAGHALLEVVADGPGSRGLVAIDEVEVAPVGPTMRDAAGESGVLVGRIEAEPAREGGRAVRLWFTMDPLRVAADHALAIAEARLGAA